MQQATIGAHAPSTTLRILSGVAGLALLAGCQTANVGGDATRAAAPDTSVQLIERDVEAPEVFQVSERALWDGRPSLGGVWVASPDVTEPERVIIRDEATGKFVIGALFRRERVSPGPPLQLSSDAAIALGVLAGTPVTLEVVALRRQEVPDPAAPPVAAAPAPVSAAPEVADEASAADAPQGDRVEVLRVAARALRQKREAERRAAEAAASAAAVESAEPAEGSAVPEVTASSLDAPEQAAAATPRRRGPGGLFGNRPDAETGSDASALPAAVTRAVAEAAPTRAFSGAPTDGAYVQVGIFSVERNARDAATALAGAGVLPTVLEQKAQGRTVWRVVVGPAPSRADRAAVLRKARALGFEDAYAVTG